MQEIYDEAFVKELFNKMSVSYTRMNRITSFGFSERWRRRFVRELPITDQAVVVDFMTGMGECWPYILEAADRVSLVAVDFSEEMLKYANRQKATYRRHRITVLQENVLSSSVRDDTADFLVSGFGLKTFDDNQLRLLAREVHRILKPGGQFSLVDVSLPKSRLLRIPYLFYLKNVIPHLGKLFLGNPATYKMLGIYTERYGNSERVMKVFSESDLKVSYLEYFFGCATGIKGYKQP